MADDVFRLEKYYAAMLVDCYTLITLHPMLVICYRCPRTPYVVCENASRGLRKRQVSCYRRYVRCLGIGDTFAWRLSAWSTQSQYLGILRATDFTYARTLVLVSLIPSLIECILLDEMCVWRDLGDPTAASLTDLAWETASSRWQRNEPAWK